MNRDRKARFSMRGGWVDGVGRRRLWLVVLAGGIGLFAAVRRALLTTADPTLVPALLAVGALVVPTSFVVFIHSRRLPQVVTAATLGAVAACGGVIGVVVAAIVEFDVLRPLGLLAVFGVAVIEEISKLIVPVVLLSSGRWSRVGDGLTIGVASGAGFAALETMGYAFVALVNSHGDLAVVDGTLILRGLLSPAGHMAWTGITAAALWHARRAGFSAPSVCWLVTACGAAVALHTAWDGMGGPATYGIVGALGLTLLVAITRRLRRPADPDPAAWPFRHGLDKP